MNSFFSWFILVNCIIKKQCGFLYFIASLVIYVGKGKWLHQQCNLCTARTTFLHFLRYSLLFGSVLQLNYLHHKSLISKVFFTCNVYFRRQWFSAQSADHGQISISRWEQIYFFHLFFTEKFGADTLIYKSTELSTEAVVQRCSVKKMFLKISQNSQENTCVRVSFLIKLWILRNF